MTTIARTITGGVDTHLDVHVAAALVRSLRTPRSAITESRVWRSLNPALS
jgi:hypothetical protein